MTLEKLLELLAQLEKVHEIAVDVVAEAGALLNTDDRVKLQAKLDDLATGNDAAHAALQAKLAG